MLVTDNFKNLITLFLPLFFSERKDVSERQVLTQTLQKIGIKIDEALTRLDDEDARGQVEVQ